MKKSYLITLIIAAVVGGVGFFGGMTFQKGQDSLSGLSGTDLTAKLENLGMSSNSTSFGARQFNGSMPDGVNFNGTPPEDMTNGDFRGGPAGFGGNMTMGEIVTVGSDNFTVKSEDGSTSIVYFSDSTTVDKTVTGDSTDLTVGTTVRVTGETNSDDSVTASTIQVEPTQ